MNDLPPLPVTLPVGWTIGIENDYIHFESALPHLHKLLSDNSVAAEDVMLFIAANTDCVLSSSTFFSTPLETVQAMLDCPTLSIDEDVLLAHVLLYAAHKAGAKTDSLRLMSPKERRAIEPVLCALVPRLAIMSLSPLVFLRTVEPMGILSVTDLSAKYKYDALLSEALAGGLSERDMVLECYGGTANFSGRRSSVEDVVGRAGQLRGEVTGPRMRARAVISESAHTYDMECTEELDLVEVAGWAGQTCVEFDRRTRVGDDAQLTFYGDKDGQSVLAEWKLMWRKPNTRGRKFIVFPGNRFWVGLQRPADVKALWGWKLRATPVIDGD
jgi:hypothetical protein